MILVIDNYDSFTFNLVQLLYTLGAEVKVARNDEIDAEGVAPRARRTWWCRRGRARRTRPG